MTLDGDYGGRATELPPLAEMIPDSDFDATTLLAKILRALEPPDELYDFVAITPAGQMGLMPTHVKIKTKYIVLTPSVAQVVNLRVGSMGRLFAMASAETKVFPFPFIIHRGADVTITPSAGTVSGYLVAMPQNESDEDHLWR